MSGDTAHHAGKHLTEYQTLGLLFVNPTFSRNILKQSHGNC